MITQPYCNKQVMWHVRGRKEIGARFFMGKTEWKVPPEWGRRTLEENVKNNLPERCGLAPK